LKGYEIKELITIFKLIGMEIPDLPRTKEDIPDNLPGHDFT